MPIYEYACESCGEQTEVFQRLSDPPASKCPACGKEKLTKLVSASGFRLSGGGWYETDFKSDGKRNLAGDAEPKKEAKAEESAKSGDAKDAGSKPATDTTSKPDAKPDPKAAKKAEPKTEPGKPSGPKAA